MSKTYTSDPDLANLASQLRDISLGITPEDITAFLELPEWRNLSMFPDKKTYRVRLCLGGKTRTLGSTLDGPAAALFADCARLYFWPYRIRDARPPSATDMNFSVARAQVELDSNPAVQALLDALRRHLDLKTVSDTGAADRKKERQSRRTVRYELSTLLREMLAEAVEEITHQNKEAIALEFQHLLKEVESLKEYGLANLETVLTAIRRLGEQLPGPTPFSLVPPPQPFVEPPNPWTGIPLPPKEWTTWCQGQPGDSGKSAFDNSH